MFSQNSQNLSSSSILLEKAKSILRISQSDPLESFVLGYLVANKGQQEIDDISNKIEGLSQFRKAFPDKQNEIEFALAQLLQNEELQNVNKQIQLSSKVSPVKSEMIYDESEEYKLSEQLINKMKEQDYEELEKIRQEKEQQNSVDCKICLDELLNEECCVIDSCGHVYHKECLKHHASQRIQERSLPIYCPEPECKGEIQLADLEGLVNKEDLDKYREFSLKNYLDQETKDASWCPTADCPFVFINEAKISDFTCPVCEKRYCFLCKVQYHQGQTCQQYQASNKDVDSEDKKFYDLIEAKQFKQCPKCNYWIEKNKGCHKMHCRCGFTFCYTCGKKPCECKGMKNQRDFGREDMRFQGSRRRNQDFSNYQQNMFQMDWQQQNDRRQYKKSLKPKKPKKWQQQYDKSMQTDEIFNEFSYY